MRGLLLAVTTRRLEVFPGVLVTYADKERSVHSTASHRTERWKGKPVETDTCVADLLRICDRLESVDDDLEDLATGA